MSRPKSNFSQTLTAILKPYELPADIPEVRTCKMCGEPMRLLKVNPYVCFWTHEGEALKKCCEKNTLNPGTPYIMWYMGFSKKFANDLYGGNLLKNGNSNNKPEGT